MQFPVLRYRITAAAILAAIVLAPAAALAEKFPSRPMTLIIPWQPGGVPDTAYRVLADIASKHLGQPIVVENKPGGVGSLGPASMAANAKPDGYTISYIGGGVFRAPYLFKATYDPRKDFTYIRGIGQYQLGLVVRADSPIKSWSDFVAYAKANPGKLTYTTFGVNSPLHMDMEQIAAISGIKLKHIPSRGNTENNAAVLGGHVMASADGSTWAPLVDSGDFRLLVTFGEKRATRWPNVPTLRDVGIDVVDTSPFGLGGPAGMDPEVVKILADAYGKALHDPRYAEVLKKFDMDMYDADTETYSKWALAEIDRQQKVIEKFAEKTAGK